MFRKLLAVIGLLTVPVIPIGTSLPLPLSTASATCLPTLSYSIYEGSPTAKPTKASYANCQDVPPTSWIQVYVHCAYWTGTSWTDIDTQWRYGPKVYGPNGVSSFYCGDPAHQGQMGHWVYDASGFRFGG